MLPRTAFRALRFFGAAHAIAPCSLCMCSCGSVIRDHEPSSSTQQKRWKMSVGRAPSTRSKVRRAASRPLTPKQRESKRNLEVDDSLELWRTMDSFRKHGLLHCDPNAVVDFMTAFAQLAYEARGSNDVDLERYRQHLQELYVNEATVMICARKLLQSPRADHRLLGKKLLFTLSRNGFEEATVRILNHAMLQEKTNAGALRSSEIVYMRGQLREIARKGINHKAMVLEGMIAYQLGDRTYAISTLNDAMEPAMAAAKFDAAIAGMGTPKAFHGILMATAHDVFNLSSPWIELAYIHYESCLTLESRGDLAAADREREKAREATEIGCEQDDPTSHFQAALILPEIHTSAWLYHITKAAASGHVKAMHTLAQFYAESGWKYIEDEPPDNVKPTPFDSYPVPNRNTPTTLWGGFMQSLGLRRRPDFKPSDDLFHTATFPSTPAQRWILAIQWLELSMRYDYAPSYLLAAQMHLDPILWSQAQAPTSALRLSPKRYTYASKADYDNHSRIPKPDVVPAEDTPKATDPEKAKTCLRNVLYAAEAHRHRARVHMRVQALNRGTTVDEDNVDLTRMYRDAPSQITRWLRFPDVWEQYEDQIWQLEDQAKQICDANGFDIVGEDGGLMYRHRQSRVAVD